MERPLTIAIPTVQPPQSPFCKHPHHPKRVCHLGKQEPFLLWVTSSRFALMWKWCFPLKFIHFCVSGELIRGRKRIYTWLCYFISWGSMGSVEIFQRVKTTCENMHHKKSPGEFPHISWQLRSALCFEGEVRVQAGGCPWRLRFSLPWRLNRNLPRQLWALQ